MSKLKIGEQVLPTDPGSEQRVLTISGRETHKHYEFYRVRELPGALFLSSSLSRVKGGFITLKPHGPSPEVAPMQRLRHCEFCGDGPFLSLELHKSVCPDKPDVAPRETQGECDIRYGQVEIRDGWCYTHDCPAWMCGVPARLENGGR